MAEFPVRGRVCEQVCIAAASRDRSEAGLVRLDLDDRLSTGSGQDAGESAIERLESAAVGRDTVGPPTDRTSEALDGRCLAGLEYAKAQADWLGHAGRLAECAAAGLAAAGFGPGGSSQAQPASAAATATIAAPWRTARPGRGR